MKKPADPIEINQKWQQEVKNCEKHLNDQNYGLYRCSRFNMAMLAKKKEEHFQTLQLLAEVIFWDLTGICNNFDYQRFLEMRMRFLFPYEKTIMKLAPGVIREVGICQRKLGYSDEELRAALLKNLENMTAPIQFFTHLEIVDIFFWECEGNTTQLKKIYAKAKKRFDPKHPNTVDG